MSSMQAPAGASKADKFKAANPLGPMADPFQGMDDDQKEYHRVLSENVNKRLEKSMKELKERHAKGTNEVDDADFAPTGDVYKQIRRIQSQRDAEARAAEDRRRQLTDDEQQKARQKAAAMLQLHDEEGENSDSDSSYDSLLDDDPELEAIRQKRLAELKAKQIQHAENVAKGHGEIRTISQDEFLPECTSSSKWVAVHFFHNDFERCKIMDHHLGLVARRHVECKFLRINAEKAPFFVTKLKIQTLPTLLVFEDGKTIDRLVGFEGLATNLKKPDEWPTRRLEEWLDKTGAIEFVPSPEDEEDEDLAKQLRKMGFADHYRGKSVYSRDISYDDEY